MDDQTEFRLPLQLKRFYRSEPRLNQCTDEQCHKLLLQAKIRRGDAAWFLPGLVAAGAAAIYLIASGLVIRLILTTAAGTAANAATSTTNSVTTPTPAPDLSGLEHGLWGVNLLVAIGVFVLVFIVWSRILLLRTMLSLLNKASCPECAFSLKGLMAENGTVCCPECGSRIVLIEHRLTEDDLMPDTPSGRARMREHWKKQGADARGAYTASADQAAAPKGQHKGQWHSIKDEGQR